MPPALSGYQRRGREGFWARGVSAAAPILHTARLSIDAVTIAAAWVDVITCSGSPRATMAAGTPSWALASSPAAGG